MCLIKSLDDLNKYGDLCDKIYHLISDEDRHTLMFNTMFGDVRKSRCNDNNEGQERSLGVIYVGSWAVEEAAKAFKEMYLKYREKHKLTHPI